MPDKLHRGLNGDWFTDEDVRIVTGRLPVPPHARPGHVASDPETMRKAQGAVHGIAALRSDGGLSQD